MKNGRLASRAVTTTSIFSDTSWRKSTLQMKIIFRYTHACSSARLCFSACDVFAAWQNGSVFFEYFSHFSSTIENWNWSIRLSSYNTGSQDSLRFPHSTRPIVCSMNERLFSRCRAIFMHEDVCCVWEFLYYLCLTSTLCDFKFLQYSASSFKNWMCSVKRWIFCFKSGWSQKWLADRWTLSESILFHKNCKSKIFTRAWV